MKKIDLLYIIPSEINPCKEIAKMLKSHSYKIHHSMCNHKKLLFNTFGKKSFSQNKSDQKVNMFSFLQ